jgi:hypothetical protein
MVHLKRPPHSRDLLLFRVGLVEREHAFSNQRVRSELTHAGLC